MQSSSPAVDSRRGPRPHWTIRSCPLGFQTWCLRSVAGNLFRGDGFAQGKACFSRKGHCFTKARDHFQSQRAELLRNHGRFCFPCCPTLVHKPDVKYWNSSDRANCAHSWWANWGPLSVITLARITCQRDPVFQPSVIAAAALLPNASRESPKNGAEQPSQRSLGSRHQATQVSSAYHVRTAL